MQRVTEAEVEAYISNLDAGLALSQENIADLLRRLLAERNELESKLAAARREWAREALSRWDWDGGDAGPLLDWLCAQDEGGEGE